MTNKPYNSVASGRKSASYTPIRKLNINNQSQASIELKESAANISMSMRPKILLVVCYICGHQFGSASISLHIPRCIGKWQKFEA